MQAVILALLSQLRPSRKQREAIGMFCTMFSHSIPLFGLRRIHSTSKFRFLIWIYDIYLEKKKKSKFLLDILKTTVKHLLLVLLLFFTLFRHPRPWWQREYFALDTSISQEMHNLGLITVTLRVMPVYGTKPCFPFFPTDFEEIERTVMNQWS